ncbi:response regulator [Leptolyngbya sp. DQ-M1]|uniref:response regulator n=1 Tax=Leptolyngbya sp. DQ-M1 TaxID=2933920 RepID=UPI003297467B
MNDLLSSPPLRALIVDDDLDSVILLTTLLEMHGVDVTSAFCADQAMQKLRSQPDILIADLAMPHIDGYELIRQIRTLPPEQGGQIPAIAVSAWVAIEAQNKAVSAGFHTFITKPYQLTELLETVSQLTDWRPLESGVTA